MLELKNISYEVEEQNSNVAILRDISLTIEDKFVAITGPNGGGKSTLAKHINAILTPNGRKRASALPSSSRCVLKG